MAARLSLTLMFILSVVCLGCGRHHPDGDQTTQAQPPGNEDVTRELIAGSKAPQRLGAFPLSFVENKGQADPAAKFLLRGPRGSIFFTQNEVVFEIFETDSAKSKEPADTATGITERSGVRKGVVVRVSFPGANPTVAVEGTDGLPGTVNIMRGNDPTAWQTNVRTYASVVYRGLYPGIDLRFSGEHGTLTRTFSVRTDGTVENVRMKYDGIEALEITPDGDIRLKTALGTIREKSPAFERQTESGTVPMTITPLARDRHEVGFTIASP